MINGLGIKLKGLVFQLYFNFIVETLVIEEIEDTSDPLTVLFTF